MPRITILSAKQKVMAFLKVVAALVGLAAAIKTLLS